MTSLHDLPESTKRLFDTYSLVLAGVSGVTVMNALNLIAVIVAILSGLASLSWTIWRWRNSIRRPDND